MSSVLDLSRRLLALSQTGLHFSTEEYDRERYREIGDIAARLLELQGGASAAPSAAPGSSSTGYATPKVEVRGAIFRDDRVLLVRERADGKWTVAGRLGRRQRHAEHRGAEGDRAGVRLHGAHPQAGRRRRSQQAQSPAVAVSFLESVLHLRDHRRRGAHQLRDDSRRVLPAGRTAGVVDGPLRRPSRSAACTGITSISTCRPSSTEHVRTRPPLPSGSRGRSPRPPNPGSPKSTARRSITCRGTLPILTSRRCCSHTASARTRAGGASSRRSSSAASASYRSTSPAWATAATGASTRR